LALVYFTAGRFADSQHELDRALALDPASQEALQLRDRLRAAQ
jgi:Tfp pilus assembly protein PilF